MRNSQLKVALEEFSDIEVFFRLKIETLHSGTVETNQDFIDFSMEKVFEEHDRIIVTNGEEV